VKVAASPVIDHDDVHGACSSAVRYPSPFDRLRARMNLCGIKNDLMLRSRAKHGVSKHAQWRAYALVAALPG
jgi:hypothetical protein